jgi:SAM-dependent methyltransferases related to tRNA (uracil-5-)-methyltransferase
MAKPLSDKQKLRNFFRDAAARVETIDPACRHFRDCGGCEFQHIPYDRQLAMKQEAFSFITDTVIEDYQKKAAADRSDPDKTEQADILLAKAELLEQYAKGRETGIVSSPSAYGYRQRMDYVFAWGEKAGLRRANRHRQVVELEECPLLGDAGFAVFQKALRLAKAAGLECYDYVRHHGELRYFVVRRSREGGILLSLVTKTRGAGERVASVLQELVEDGDIVSGHWLLADGLGDVSFGEPLAHFGEVCIFEELDGVRLGIGPNTFFQANPAVAEIAYTMIRDFAPAGGTVLDMFSGVGSIAFFIASGAGQVLAVESVPENVNLANLNSRENNCPNVILVEEDASVWLERTAADPEAAKPDMVVVNPPRPGVGDKGMAAVKKLLPGKVAYLSCNPFTLLRDLTMLLDAYELTSVTVFDMFPQTRHFETLALLTRK